MTYRDDTLGQATYRWQDYPWRPYSIQVVDVLSVRPENRSAQIRTASGFTRWVKLTDLTPTTADDNFALLYEEFGEVNS